MRQFIQSVGFLAASSIFILSQTVKALDHSDGTSPYGDGFAPDVVVTDWALNSSYPIYEGTSPPDLTDDYNTGGPSDGGSNLTRRAAKDFYLRVMPLGASITEGIASSDGNGYRKWLRSQLRWKGWKVNMVGSKQNGNMADRVFTYFLQCCSYTDVWILTVLFSRTMKDILDGL
jgi:hypothetical protein